MESTKEATMKRGKRPKSPTRYPKRMPTYVVAFAVQETHDDPQKIQLITSTLSSENDTPSLKSISPTDSQKLTRSDSTKTFTITPSEKLSRVLDTATVSEVKIDIIDENHCGDVIEKRSPQISSYIEIDNRPAQDGQPKIICNAPKHIKRCKDSNRFPRKKSRKSKRVITFKNIHLKYIKQKNCMTRRLEKYYEKTKLNIPNAEQIQKQIYSTFLSKVVSRSQVFKKKIAKENLLTDSDKILLNDDGSIFDYDENSTNSSPTTTKKSFTSYTSQNTLVRKASSSSRNEDFNTIKTTNSVILSTSDNPIPYKSEAINVALAVTFNVSETNNDENVKNRYKEIINKEHLTSSETIVQSNTTELTSKPPSNEEPKYYEIDYDELRPVNLNQADQNNVTLNQKEKSVEGMYSDEDTFVIARTSSEFNKSSINSDCTLTFSSETKLQIENVPSNLSTNDESLNCNSKKTTLVDKVKNLGYYPKQTPSIGSGANFCSDLNDVLVTDNVVKPLTSNNISGDIPTDPTKNYVLRKPIEMKNMNYLQNNISLPNDLTIKAKLKEVEEEKRSCADNVRNTYPTDMNEVWERLNLVLDLAVKRLEETLADRIVKDIRASLTIFNQPEYRIFNQQQYKEPSIEIQRAETTAAPVRCERPIPIMLHKEIFVLEEHLKREVDMCVQCDLVQRQIIDQLMLKLSAEAPKPIPSSLQDLKVLQPPEILKDYVEILKPRVSPVIDSASVEEGKDTVTVSTATTQVSFISGLSRFKLLFSGPMEFIRENTFVLTSVPTFFVVLFCIYGVIVIIMKP